MNNHKRPFSVDPSEYPFESHWFEHNDSAMHYLDEGEGVPVVLLHGNPTWSFLYRKVIKELRNSCRLIAPDLPGFGMSEHPPEYGYTPDEHTKWINALIDHLKLDRFILMVQDWGGPIGMSVAISRPDEIAGLVISNTWAWKQDNWMFTAFSSVLGSPIGKYLILRHNFFAKRLMPSLLTQQDIKTPIVLSAYTAPFPTRASRMGTYVFPKEINGSSAWLTTLESKLHRLADKPVQLVMGDKDVGLGSDEIVARWKTHFPHAAVDRVANAGHYIQEEAPDRVVAAIKRILGQIV